MHFGHPPLLIPVPLHRPKPPSCRDKGDLTACFHLLIERGADPKAANNGGATPLSLVYSPEPVPGVRYSSGRPRGYLTFKERAVIVSMLLDLGADTNTKINLLQPEESNSDVESDDPNAYSDSESGDSLNTAPASDYASSGGSYGPPSRRRGRHKYRSLYAYGPLSVLQCAFWDGDLDLCRSLLDRGVELTTPIVAWMLHLAWGYCRWRMRDAAERVLQVLGDLEVSRQTELGSHPACLYVLITQGVRHMAADLLELGIERSKFDSVPGPEYAWLFGDETTASSSTWADLCLAQAVQTDWLAGIEPLLQLGLGVDSNPPSLLLGEAGKSQLNLAVTRRRAAMVSHLVRHGAKVNLCDEDDTNDKDNDTVRFKRSTRRRYPLVAAIRTDDPAIISALLRGPGDQHDQPPPLPDKFAFAYLREAYMTRRAKSLNHMLLQFPSVFNPRAKAGRTGNTHLVEILQNVSAICARQSSPPRWLSGNVVGVGGDDTDDDEDDGYGSKAVWNYSIKAKLDQVRVWIECVVMLARAGVSGAEKNAAGVSAVDVLEGLVNYKGPDRFRVHVRSALRSRLNEVMGLAVWEETLSAAEAMEALGRAEPNLDDSEGSGSSSAEWVDD